MYQEYSKQKMIFLFQNFSLKIETNSTFLVLNVDADKTTKRQKHKHIFKFNTNYLYGIKLFSLIYITYINVQERHDFFDF